VQQHLGDLHELLRLVQAGRVTMRVTGN
jgi:hypothetical protein